MRKTKVAIPKWRCHKYGDGQTLDLAGGTRLTVVKRIRSKDEAEDGLPYELFFCNSRLQRVTIKGTVEPSFVSTIEEGKKRLLGVARRALSHSLSVVETMLGDIENHHELP